MARKSKETMRLIQLGLPQLTLNNFWLRLTLYKCVFLSFCLFIFLSSGFGKLCLR